MKKTMKARMLTAVVAGGMLLSTVAAPVLTAYAEEPLDTSVPILAGEAAEASTPESAVPEVTPDPIATPEQAATPETPDPGFEVLGIATESASEISARVGEIAEMSVQLNRQDVAVSYQWQRLQLAGEGVTLDAALYDYGEDEPTWYAYLIEDVSESERLAEDAAVTWPGIELYYAIEAALDEIGADSSDVSVAWHTENYALEGYEISAAYVGGSVEVYADRDGERHVGQLDADGKWAFGDAEAQTASWQDIEGATGPTYPHTVEQADYTAQFRCQITVTDEAYKEAVLGALAGQGVEVPAEDLEATQTLYGAVVRIANPDAQQAAETPAGQAGVFSAFSAFASMFSVPVGGSGEVALSEDQQWVTGLTGDYEYITQDTYDRVQAWLAAGQVTQEQADRYWTKIGGSGGKKYEANVLDANGFPTGETRIYRGFTLTDGKLEVNSQWYGKTVYFRLQGSKGTGTAVDIPAYTTDGAAAGTYKKAITVLNPYVSDTGPVYFRYLTFLDSDLTYEKDTHINIYPVVCETFNADPNQFLMDAEGNYRMDTVAWGVCTAQEPDLSGAAYWALKAYIAQGYGFMVGHDTMYGYAGAYYDAFGTDFTEDMIDPDDTSTHYYQINSWLPNDGHWRMNALMGSNAGNVESGTVAPSDAPSKILSSGGSHSHWGKTLLFGNDELQVLGNGYTAAQAAANTKYRTPTNYPYSYEDNSIVPASLTHTNSQVAFGTIWINYNGCSDAFVGAGSLAEAQTWQINGQTGTNNFYLSGDGNFLMNQIGHLLTNTAKTDEVKLLVNSLMYVSQRKQCEICQAEQDGDTDVHFVHRVNSANADAVLSALQAGGSYWYPIDDCYMLTEDLVLPEDWQPIQGFTGHWDSDGHTVTLAANGQPLFDWATWQLGSDKTAGEPTVLTGPDARVTGIARFACCAASLSPQAHGGIASVVPEQQVLAKLAG